MSDICSTTTRSLVKVSGLWLLIGLFVLILDQWTKNLVYTYLPPVDSMLYWYPYGGIGVFKNFAGIEFSINHITNQGAAWGLLASYPLPLIFLRMGAILILGVYLLYFNRNSLWQLPLVLIMTGAVGNVLDFFVYGYVVDMLHFVFWGYDFPVFNLADSAISTGVAALFFLSWFKVKS